MEYAISKMNIYNKDIQKNRLCKIVYKSYVKKVKKI